MRPRFRWPPVLAAATVLGVAGFVIARRAGRLARRSARSSFHLEPANRLVAVGVADPGHVRIWVRSDRAGRHLLELEDPQGHTRIAAFEVRADPELDRTTVVRWPEDAGGDPLAAGTAYRFRVHAADGTFVGEGSFQTAPDERTVPDRVAVAVASCHQPFDDSGDPRPASIRMLDGIGPLLAENDVQVVLLLGDQLYTDVPAGHSLFARRAFARVAPPGRRRLLDCSREEVRRLLQQRYRVFWKVEGFRRLQANWPTICMLDDHEVVDNFGSDPAHATQAWAGLREGALDAFHDYQALRNHDRADRRPEAFPTRFAWGPIAGLVLDLRSQRHADAERIHILGESQWALLERFLAEEAARPVLVLGLSVPLLHAPEWMVGAAGLVAPDDSNVRDRWSHPDAVADRDRLVHLLHAHRRRSPDQQVVLASGDVHVGAVSELSWDGAPSVWQLVSSALSNLESRTMREASATLATSEPSFDTADGLRVTARLLAGAPGCEANPFTGLNAGIVVVERRADGWQVHLRLVGLEPDASAPRVVFDGRLPRSGGTA